MARAQEHAWPALLQELTIPPGFLLFSSQVYKQLAQIPAGSARRDAMRLTRKEKARLPRFVQPHSIHLFSFVPSSAHRFFLPLGHRVTAYCTATYVHIPLATFSLIWS